MLSPNIRSRIKSLPVMSSLHAAVRGALQTREAERSLTDAARLAEQRGIVCPTGEALQAKLRERLSARRGGREAKARGQMHIFLAYGIHNWEAIFPLALSPFGRVSQFEWRSHGFDERLADWPERRDAMNAAMLDAFRRANREEPVDAVVAYVSGATVSPEMLLTMTGEGAAVFNFCWDDKLNFPGVLVGGRYASPAGIAHAVDLNLTNAPGSVIKYAAYGGLAMFWPEAAHPDVHKPYDAPFEFDVSFVGMRYGQRPAFMKALQRQGVHVECFGKGWPNGPLSDEEMVKLYSRSRINLGFAGVGFSRTLMCIKGRDFEVPMSGGLYLTQHNPELSLAFDIGREIVTYRDEVECAVRIKELLADPQRAQSIRQAGRERCLRDHTYEKRWEQVFAMAGLMRT